jgi:hypothetical protein
MCVTGGLIAQAAALAAATVLGGGAAAPGRAVNGVRHVEIDAAARLDLARRLRISCTPTVLVLGPDGAIVRRAVGQPRKADVIAALGPVIEP